MVTTKQIELLNIMNMTGIIELNEVHGLSIVIEDGRITAAEYEGGNANG